MAGPEDSPMAREKTSGVTRGSRRRAWKRKLRRELAAVERRAETILTIDTDFHTRLAAYRAALFSGLHWKPLAS